MRKFQVSALLEGYRITDEVMAVSVHHAIKIMRSKYNNAGNFYVLNSFGALKRESEKKEKFYLVFLDKLPLQILIPNSLITPKPKSLLVPLESNSITF